MPMELDDDIDDDGDLQGFIAKDDEMDDDEEYGKPLPKNVKQPNRRIIQDSDGESEAEEEEKPSKKDKGKGKEKAAPVELPDWMAKQEPSTKMKWALAEVQRLDAEFPDDKIIIISSFTTALDLMADMLYEADFKVTRYQGDMTRKERDDSVKVLKKSKKCKIMLSELTLVPSTTTLEADPSPSSQCRSSAEESDSTSLAPTASSRSVSCRLGGRQMP
jgi:SNF2 family DNA or RNA helicase